MSIRSRLTRVVACVVVIITMLTVFYSLGVALQYPAARPVYATTANSARQLPAGSVGVVQTADHKLSERPSRGEQWYMTSGQPEKSGRR